MPYLEDTISFPNLLIESAKSDGEFSKAEIDKIISIIKNKLKLEDKPAHDLFYKTLELNQDNIEMYSITKDIRDNFDADEIKGIVKYIWYVVLSDGHLDDFEAALMRKFTMMKKTTMKLSSPLLKQFKMTLLMMSVIINDN